MNVDRNHTGITLRRLRGSDERAVEELAQLDSKPRPEGDLLGIEVEGRLLAAASISSGTTIADPFSRTAEIRALLELRIAQLRLREPARSGSGIRNRSRAALPGSPPGAGGKLLTLPVRST